jgi:tol-pal system protein YbgF
MTRQLALAVLLLLATGCATRGSYHQLRTEVSAVRGEVNDLRQAHTMTSRDLARVTAERRALEARASELSNALNEAAAEVARLHTRVEAAEAEAREAKAEAQRAAQPSSAPPVTPPPSAAPRPLESTPRSESPEQAYNAALTTFRAREHGQAVLDFLDFIAKHPKHPLVANARYWIGEAYYAQRDYRQALAEFQKVLEVAPDSPKAADALLKIGHAHRRLRDEGHARQSWQRVVRDFPTSEAAVKARALLR